MSTGHFHRRRPKGRWRTYCGVAILPAIGLTGCSLLFSPSTQGQIDGDVVDARVANDSVTAACPEAYTESFMGSRYRLAGNVALSWYQAQETCEEEGTHLVVIDSQEEATFLKGFGFVGWIGATDHLVESEFRWVTGAHVTGVFEEWGPSEPDDQFGSQDCVRISTDGFLWQDSYCETQLAYVCECDAQRVAKTWCRTGTDTDCDTCGDDCQGLSCATNYCSLWFSKRSKISPRRAVLRLNRNRDVLRGSCHAARSKLPRSRPIQYWRRTADEDEYMQ